MMPVMMMEMTMMIKMRMTETIKMKMTETIKMKMMKMIKMMIHTFKQNNPSKLNSCLKNTDFLLNIYKMLIKYLKIFNRKCYYFL
jgi:hypothetical protein